MKTENKKLFPILWVSCSSRYDKYEMGRNGKLMEGRWLLGAGHQGTINFYKQQLMELLYIQYLTKSRPIFKSWTTNIGFVLNQSFLSQDNQLIILFYFYENI